MTRFETILRLAEIQGILKTGNGADARILLSGVIRDLSESFQEEPNEDCEHECPAFSECPDTTHLYARKVCVGCGHHHE